MRLLLQFAAAMAVHPPPTESLAEQEEWVAVAMTGTGGVILNDEGSFESVQTRIYHSRFQPSTYGIHLLGAE